MIIDFQNIEIEGFRSIVKPTGFELDRPGLNLIKGINGSGKTTIFEALIWALYGTNLKDTVNGAVASWPEVRPPDWQGTRVSVTFKTDDVYTVTRHLGYKGETYGVKGEDTLLLVKGDQLSDYKNKDLTQQAINTILGIDSRTFVNSILFGQRMARLITQDNKDKRDLFETLFETAWVGQAKERCDADIAQWNTDLLNAGKDLAWSSSVLTALQDKLVMAKNQINSFEENRSNRITEKQHELGQYLTDLIGFDVEKLEYEIAQQKLNYNDDDYQKLLKDNEELDGQINTANIEGIQHRNKITNATTAIINAKATLVKSKAAYEKLKAKQIDKTCPSCGQELKPGNQLEKNHKLDLAEAKKEMDADKASVTKAENALKALEKVVITDVATLNKELGELNDKIDALTPVKTDYDQYTENIKAVDADIVQTEKDIDRVNREIASIKAEKPPVVDIKGIEKQIADKEAEIKQLEEDKPKLEKKIEIAKWWSSKGFSAGGIKAFIFKAMLTQLNQNVKKYGDRLGASLEFSIDLTKASKPFTTICSLGDKLNKDYKEFSGGQKQRLDIVLIFAMFDLISMNSDMNVLIMDEVFEGLDEEGQAAVFDLVREKANEGRSVYVITHSPVLDSLYSSEITMELVNGRTVINY